MKKILSITAGAVLVSGLALAQGGPGTGGSTGPNQHSWSNYLNESSPPYSAVWGTNYAGLTEAPLTWRSNYQHSVSGATTGGAQTQNRFGKPELPTDVKAIVQKFQQDRTRLMSQLRTCSDEQRQQILRDMEQLRTQLREQLCQIREQAQQQAEQMRNRFGNNRERMLNQGAGGVGTGRDR